MRIGITDTLKEDKYIQYVEWIHSIDESLEILKLSHEIGNCNEISALDGLILSGGGDLHPRYYGKDEEFEKTKSVNEARDEFEFKLIEKALDAEIPILGICRGMQIMNVFLGGSLILDLESDGFKNHTSVSEKEPTIHEIKIQSNTLLQLLAGTQMTKVNSFHHQGIDKLGRGLICSSVSDDGVIESAEWAIKDNMPFIMLIQWHPERIMKSFLSQKIARIFLREVSKYTNN